MSADSAFASPLVEEGVTFQPLLTADYGTLETRVRANGRARIRALLDECKVVGSERFVALRDSDAADIYILDVDNYLRTRDGATTAVALSLKKSGHSDQQAAEIIGRYGILDLINLARTLIGFAVRERPAAAAAAEPEAQSPLADGSGSSGPGETGLPSAP